MHACPECGMACDCDGEDTWIDSHALNCTHECEEEDDDLYDNEEGDMSKTTWLCRDAETDAEDDWTEIEIEAIVETPEEAACQFAIEADHMSAVYQHHRMVAVKRNEQDEPELYEVEMVLQPAYTAWPVVDVKGG